MRFLVPIAAVLALAGCKKQRAVSGVDQGAVVSLVDFKSPKANLDRASGDPKLATKRLTLGPPDDKLVPVEVKVMTARDAAGCLRIQTVHMRRLGGPTSTEIYDVMVTGEFPATCTVEQASVTYCYRWNGAADDSECAYRSSFGISGQQAGAPKR